MSDVPESRYKIPEFEKGINRFIGLIFYWRLALVVLSVVAVVIISYIVYQNSPNGDSLRNTVYVLTAGSIIIGIFYSIINYEHNQIKFKHDVKTNRETLTFNTACKLIDNEMMFHFRKTRVLYNEHKHMFLQNKFDELDVLLADPDNRKSFAIVFNYFEIISIGIKKEILDEGFLKDFLIILCRNHNNWYGTYLEYLRKSDPESFIHFSEMARRWLNLKNV